MYILKTISKDAVPAALERAKQYRLLGDPLEAESICRDILEVDPDNQDALITLLLSLTDSFKQQLNPAFSQAQEVLQQLGDQYCQAYYGGILCERRGKVHLERGGPGSGRMAYEWLRKAMENYEKALNSCSPGNQDAILRWNSCARILMRNPQVGPSEDEAGEQMLE
jgi:tetratricopeptide (TPR) repeat protein